MNKKILKTILALLLALTMLVTAACNRGDSGDNNSSSGGEASSLESTDSGVESPGEGSSVVQSDVGNTSGSSLSKNNVSTTSSTISGSKTSLTRDQVMAKMPANLKGTSLTYFYWWDAKTQVEKEAIEQFEKTTGITVKTEVGSYSEFPSLLAARIAAGNSPDLVRLLSNAMYQVTSLQPITNSGFDFNDTAWDADLMCNYTYDGRIYATNLQNSAIRDVGLIYYNIRALQKAELQDPYEIWKKNPADWTWDKLFSMCDEFLKANNNRLGFYGMSTPYENFYIRAFGARNYDYDPVKGKWVNYMKDPELAKRYEIMVDAINKNIINLESGIEDGKTLFRWHGPYALRNRDQTFSTLKQNNYLGFVPTPTDSKYQVLYEYTAFGIPVGAKNAKAAPYYLRYVLDPKSYDMSKYYINDKAKEVVEWINAKGKFFWGENSTYAVKTALYTGTPAQVKSTLDSYYGVIQGFVDASNEAIKVLKK